MKTAPSVTIYATEPVAHAGRVYMPGQAMACDKDDAAAILTAGCGTQHLSIAKDAARAFEERKKQTAKTLDAAKRAAA
ncbi:MAG: hypothetical protein WBM09_01895 [Gallionella sp.]